MYEQLVGCAVFLPTNWSSPQTPLLVYNHPAKYRETVWKNHIHKRPEGIITFLPTD